MKNTLLFLIGLCMVAGCTKKLDDAPEPGSPSADYAPTLETRDMSAYGDVSEVMAMLAAQANGRVIVSPFSDDVLYTNTSYFPRANYIGDPLTHPIWEVRIVTPDNRARTFRQAFSLPLINFDMPGRHMVTINISDQFGSGGYLGGGYLSVDVRLGTFFMTYRYMAADFDGDGIDDIWIKDNKGNWYIDYSRNGFGEWDWVGKSYGWTDAVPVPADYDGDGKADLSVKTHTGNWFIDYARNGFSGWDWSSPGYGGADAVPIPADYDGDGKADLSVKTNSGYWFINYAHNGFAGWDWSGSLYGFADVIPAPADYDGDGKADISIRTNDAIWLIDYARNGFSGWDWSSSPYGFGDIPLPGDYDGDGKADLAIKTNDGRWLIDYAHNGFSGWDFGIYGCGGPETIAVPGDYDGDGKMDIAILTRDWVWKIDFASNGFNGWDLEIPYMHIQ